MAVEIPELKRCCFCLPLRRGLLFWTYLNVAFGLYQTGFGICNLIEYDLWRLNRMVFIFMIIAVIASIIEIPFNILFLISAHRKNHQYMRIFYRFAVGFLILEAVFQLAIIGAQLYVGVSKRIPTEHLVRVTVTSLITAMVQIVLNGYFVLLIRSELLKLKKGTKFEFINRANEAECRAQLTV